MPAPASQSPASFPEVTARASRSCPTAVPLRPSRTWWPARSISCFPLLGRAAGICAGASRPLRSAKSRLEAAPTSRPWTRPACRFDIGLAGVLGAKGTPKDIVATLNAAIVEPLAEQRHPRLADLSSNFRRASSRPRRPRRVAEGRDREVVADHQGCKYQGGVSSGRMFHKSHSANHNLTGHSSSCRCAARARRRVSSSFGYLLRLLTAAYGTYTILHNHVRFSPGLCCKTPCCAANAQLSNPNERCF